MELRPYQAEGLDKSRERLSAGTNRQLFSMATGLGKGVLFAALRSHHGFDGKVMALVHTDELAQQAEKKFHQCNQGTMIGVEMGSRRAAPMDTFIVGSVPTLGRKGSSRIEQFYPEDFSAIISDEVHHLPGDGRWQRVLEHFGLTDPGSPILSLGLTATPNRSDGKGLSPWFDEVVFDMSILDGIKQGYLVDLVCHRVNTRASLDKVHVVGKKFNDAELTKEINTPERNALIVKAWTQRAWDLRTLVFTQNVQHALDLAEAFKALGVPAAAVWGEDPERDVKLKAHRSGELTVLLNAQMLREGYDDPGIMCVILAAPHMAALPYAQEVGRLTRIPEDVSRLYGNLHAARAAGFPIAKEVGILIDVVDNSVKHPLVSITSLMGMPANLDLKGTPVSKAKEKLDRIAAEFPMANLADLKDFNKLDALTEQVKLFTVQYPPEIKQLSELAWRKSADGYQIAVNRELVTVSQDLRGEWQIRGRVGDHQAEFSAQNLAGAFNIADRFIVDNGGVKTLLKRDVRWHNDSPTDKQIALCRILKIQIPPNATKGMVSYAIDQKRAMQREAHV